MRAFVSSLAFGLALSSCTSIEFSDAGGASTGGGASGAEGGSGGGGLTAAGGTGASGGGGGEICGNDLDDDRDGLTDCEDPFCAPLCNVPEGWSGPVTLDSEGACGDTAPALVAYESIGGNSDCVCACADGPECSDTVLQAWGSSGCVGSSTGPGVLTDCIGLLNGTDSLMITREGGCAGPTATLADPSQLLDGVALCDDASGACIYQAGDVACPEGFSLKASYPTAIVDTRDCEVGSCSCVAQCGTVTLSNGENCSNPTEVLAIGTCVELQGNNLSVGLVNDVACIPSGSPAADGALSGTNPVTVCCLSTGP